MTISSFQFEDAGPHLPVEGPYGSGGNFPQPSFKPGTVTAGDNGAEFIFLLLDVVNGYTSNQGDAFVWDNTMVGSRTGEIATTGEYDIGLNCGTIFLGGKTGDSTGLVGNWSYTFTPGLYGIWVQRAGASLCNINATTTLAIPGTIGGTPSRITFLAITTKSNAIAPGSLAFMPTSKTFTADTLAGSATLLNVNVGKFIQKGMRLTGTGIPTTTASASTHIIDINGSTVTMSAAATASGTGVTITALSNSTSGTTLSGSPVLSNIQAINGFYPNQTIAGTGIPASTTILSITGSGNRYQITMSANATASANNISFTTTAMPNYNEVFLSWPYYTAATSA